MRGLNGRVKRMEKTAGMSPDICPRCGKRHIPKDEEGGGGFVAGFIVARLNDGFWGGLGPDSKPNTSGESPWCDCECCERTWREIAQVFAKEGPDRR